MVALTRVESGVPCANCTACALKPTGGVTVLFFRGRHHYPEICPRDLPTTAHTLPATVGLLAGCTHPEAPNYDKDAMVDDGSCYYLGLFDVVLSCHVAQQRPHAG